jgi:RNA polymerase sigma-70 factor (ECF subfamily)
MTNAPTRQTLLLRMRDVEDDSAWQEFVEIYTPLIYNFCRTRGLQEADAVDVVQEVLKSVSKAIQNFEYDTDKGLFRSWLYTVTRSKLNNFFNKAKKQPRGTGRVSMHAFIESYPAKDERDAAWGLEYKRHVFHWAADKIKTEFTATTWQAFWATAVEELAPEAVAEDLGMTTGAVYIAKSRVVRRLKSVVESLTGDGDPMEITS